MLAIAPSRAVIITWTDIELSTELREGVNQNVDCPSTDVEGLGDKHPNFMSTHRV